MRVVDADGERALALVDVVTPVRFAGRYHYGRCCKVVHRQQIDLVCRMIAGGHERKGSRLRATDRDAEFLVRLTVDGTIRRLRIAELVVPDGLRPPMLVGVCVEEAFGVCRPDQTVAPVLDQVGKLNAGL